jgi:hypothetical protein
MSSTHNVKNRSNSSVSHKYKCMNCVLEACSKRFGKAKNIISSLFGQHMSELCLVGWPGLLASATFQRVCYQQPKP